MAQLNTSYKKKTKQKLPHITGVKDNNDKRCYSTPRQSLDNHSFNCFGVCFAFTFLPLPEPTWKNTEIFKKNFLTEIKKIFLIQKALFYKFIKHFLIFTLLQLQLFLRNTFFQVTNAQTNHNTELTLIILQICPIMCPPFFFLGLH